MHVRRMRAVEMVLEHQLPVAVVGVLEDAARDLELAAGCAIDQIVERCLGWPEELFQPGAVSRERGEDETAVERHAWHGFQLEVFNRIYCISARKGDRLQLAGAVVAPAVVGADEALEVAATLGADQRATVRAAVDERADPAVILPDHHDRLASHSGGEVVTGAAHLALMPEHQPGAAEDALELQLEDRRIRIYGAVHAVGLHQHCELFVGGHASLW